MMAFSKYFPTPSDRMGFLWTLTGISECFVIEFGPAGTTHFAVEGVMELNAEHKMSVYTTHLSEVDITFGRDDKLTGAIREVDRSHNPKYIFVMASSVTSLIGTDIEGICNLLQGEVNARLIPVSCGGYDGDYSLGVEQALLLLAKTMVQDREPEEDFYNLIGCNIDSYNFLSDRTEITELLSKVFDLKLNTCFTAYTSVAEIEQAARARYNIVLRREGIPCAEYMKEKYGIPYVYRKPYGACRTLEWIGEIARTFKRKIDLSWVKERTEEIKTHSAQIQSSLYQAKSKKVLVYADYDTAVGFKQLLTELGLECGAVYIKHAVEGSSEDVVAAPTEDELKEALKGEYYAVFGDDVLRRLYEGRVFMQIANPNMEHYNFYRYTPLVGFNGTVRVIQELLNLRRRVT